MHLVTRVSPGAGSSHLFLTDNGTLKTVEVLVKATFKTEQKGTLLTYPFCQ